MSSVIRTQLKQVVERHRIEHGWSKAQLGRVLALRPMAVDRLLDPSHATSLNSLEATLKALGYRVRLSVAGA